MKLKYTKFQVVLEAVGLLLLIVFIAYLAANWSSLPKSLPMHYNASGAVDRWGSKNELLVMPITAIMLYILLTTVSFYPSVWNMPIKLTEENKTAVYQCTKSMLIILKIELLGIFFFITYNSAMARNLPFAFMPIALFAALITVIIAVVKMRRIGK